jgi:IS5 family transposase
MSYLQLDLPVPSYTQICRRAKILGKTVHRLCKLSHKRPTDIVFDSTGLKVYGEGEWKVRQHGISKRRTWRKFHIGIDPKSGEILTMRLTDNGKADAQVAETMLKDMPKSVKRVTGDKAYDRFRFRRCVYERGASNGTPPSINAKVHMHSQDAAVRERNTAIIEIVGLGGDDLASKLWKKLTGYHQRSLVETAMYRVKQLFGERLRSRCIERQYVESYVKCLALNTMTRLGMPKGYWMIKR